MTSERGFGPVMVDDEGHEYQVTESEARSALGGAGGILIAMIAWDFGAHDWVTLMPGSVPQYLPLMWREGVRWAGVAAGAAIFVTAWREESRFPSAEESRELNGRPFVAGKKPGWRE